MLASLRADGVPSDIPWLMSEYGYSVFAGRPEVDIEGALFNADTVGTFLTLGGAKPYLYGYEPNYLQDELKCSWGNLMMLQLNPKNDEVNRLSAYYAAQLITKEWMQPANEPHEIFPVTVSGTKDGAAGVTRPAKPKSLILRHRVCRASTGQTVGAACNQQTSEVAPRDSTWSSTFLRKAADEFCRPD